MRTPNALASIREPWTASVRQTGLASRVVVSYVLPSLAAALVGYATYSGRLVLVAIAAGAALLMLTAGRWAWFAAWALLIALGWNPPLVSFNGWEVRLADPILLGLLVVWLLRGRLSWRIAGARGLLLIVAWVLVATGVAAWYEPAFAVGALASAGRLSLTLLLAWITAGLIRDWRDAKQLLQITTIVGSVAVGFIIVQAIETGARTGALGGPNSAGIVAGFLVLAAWCRPLWPGRIRVLVGALGIAGLIATQSVASIVATAVALTLRERSGGRLRAPIAIRAGIAAAIAFVVVSSLRPETLPWNPEYRVGSAALRQTAGYAGLVTFARHPLLGVGWQRSGRAGVINDPEVIEAVRGRFPDLRGYAEASPEGVTSVHSLYSQVAAEGGLLGLSLVGAAFIAIGVETRRILRRARSSPKTGPLAALGARSLVLLAVWWNDNPLFGGQPETMLLALTLGLLSAVGADIGRESSRVGSHTAVQMAAGANDAVSIP
jgi:hypothetical protein